MHVDFEQSFVFVLRPVDVIRSRKSNQVIGLLELHTLRFRLVITIDIYVFSLLIDELFKLVRLNAEFLS